MPLLMHQDTTIFEMDFLYRAFLVFCGVALVRTAYKTFQKRMGGDRDIEGLLAIASISLFAGLSAAFRLGTMLLERADLVRIFGTDSNFMWFGYQLIELRSFYYGISLAMLGCVLLWIAYNALAILRSVWLQRVIRFRFWILGGAILWLVGWSLFTHVFTPRMNRFSMLACLDASIAVDAYRDPLEAMVYKLTPPGRFPMPPSMEEMSGDGSMLDRRLMGHTFNGKWRVVDAGRVRRALDMIHVYKSGDYDSVARADYLVRFRGRNSVVDLWIPDWGTRIYIYVSRDSAKTNSVLEFSEPYEDLMVATSDRPLRYLASDPLWLDELAAVLE